MSYRLIGRHSAWAFKEQLQKRMHVRVLFENPDLFFVLGLLLLFFTWSLNILWSLDTCGWIDL